MKKSIAALMLATIMLMSTGCTTHTQYGPCVGAFDEKDPKLSYKLAGWNIFVALAFSWAFIAPIVVVANETFCPVGTK
jgi:hypothetical protein